MAPCNFPAFGRRVVFHERTLREHIRPEPPHKPWSDLVRAVFPEHIGRQLPTHHCHLEHRRRSSDLRASWYRWLRSSSTHGQVAQSEPLPVGKRRLHCIKQVRVPFADLVLDSNSWHWLEPGIQLGYFDSQSTRVASGDRRGRSCDLTLNKSAQLEWQTTDEFFDLGLHRSILKSL